MNRQEYSSAGQCLQRTLGKVMIAIAAFWSLSAIPEESQAQRIIVSRIPGTRFPGGQVAEKPLPPGSAANAPVILRGSAIEKRSITIRFRNKAANVSKIKVERKSKYDRSWRLVRTYRTNVHRRSLVPSKIDRRARPGATYVLHDPGLKPGTKYRYRVTATQSNKPRPIELVSAIRTITTKPLDLPAAPSDLKVVSTTKSTMSLSWKDNADNENYYFCFYRIGKGAWTIKTTRSSNSTSFQLTELKPNTTYEIRVRAVGLDGMGGFSNYVFARTKGSSSTPSTVVTRTIYLKAQPIGQGPRPFVAIWPALGTLNGQLTKIEIPKVFGKTYQVYFVKPGHKTSECGTNPDATVILASGQTSTSSQLKEIFGTSQPKFPLTFVACIGASQGTVPNSVGIKISYIKTD